MLVVIGGLACPHCQGRVSRVVETRETGDALRRRRECAACGKRWSTAEVLVPERRHFRPDNTPPAVPPKRTTPKPARRPRQIDDGDEYLGCTDMDDIYGLVEGLTHGR